MNTKTNIFIVEDDLKLLALIREYLTSQGFEVAGETRGDRAGDRILREMPDLVILDLMLPGLDGLSVLRQIRPLFPYSILILTAREDDMDQVAGLEAGADDYVKKPVLPRVLLARIRAILWRNSARLTVDAPPNEVAALKVHRFGSLVVDQRARRALLKTGRWNCPPQSLTCSGT